MKKIYSLILMMGAFVLSANAQDVNDVCDTLNYPHAGKDTVYTYGAGGFVSGTNGSDKAIAEYFNNYAPFTSFTDVLMKFCYVNNATSSSITVGVWNQYAGKPYTMFASTTLPLSTIVADTAGHQLTKVTFSSPVTIPGPFYIGIVLPDYYSMDAVALYTNKDGQTNPTTAWYKDASSVWHDFMWFDGPEIHVSTDIFPIVCQSTTAIEETYELNLNIFPNPASDMLNIQFSTDHVSPVVNIFNTQGQLVKSYSADNDPMISLDISQLEAGIYFVNVVSGDKNMFQRIAVE